MSKTIYQPPVAGTRGLWFIPSNVPNPADGLLVETDNKTGYGGAIFNLECTDGSIHTIKGPWHSNPESLFHDTGIDLRDKHLVSTIIGDDFLTRDFNAPPTFNTIFLEKRESIEDFYQYLKDAERIMQEKNLTQVAVYHETPGGWSTSFVDADDLAHYRNIGRIE